MRKGERVKRRDREKGKREGHTHKASKPVNTLVYKLRVGRDKDDMSINT